MAQPTDCALFEEDEVCKPIGNKIVYGIVTESAEFLSSDEEYDEEEMVSRGKVRVMWNPKGDETVEEEKLITLVDRSLMPGDVIRRMISGKSSQRGYIQDLDVTCHIHIKGTDKYVYNVDSKELNPFKQFNIDDDVTLDPWYGKVSSSSWEDRVVFPDGAQCMVDEESLYNLEILSADGNSDCEYDHEINLGTELKGEKEDLQVLKWITETKRHNKKMPSSQKIHVRVEERQIKSVDVNWICRGFNTKDEDEINGLEIPPNMVMKDSLSKLKKLTKFEHCSVQINDMMTYTVNDITLLSEVVPGTNVESSINELNSAKSGLHISSQQSNVISTPPQLVNGGTESTSMEDGHHVDNDSGVCTHNDSLVNGIDGDCDGDDEEDDTFDASEAGAVGIMVQEDKDDHEYEDLPEQVKDKRKKGQKRSAKGRKKKKKMMEFQTKYPLCQLGETVPVVVYCTLSVASVMWQDGTVEKNIPSTELYPVHHLDEHEFFPGDFVVEAKESNDKPNYYGAIVSSDHQARTCMVNWFKLENGSSVRTSNSAEEVSVYDIKDHPEYKFRPGDVVVGVGDPQKSDVGNHTAGQVAGLDSQGGLYIQWPDNTQSFCHPQELYLIDGDMSEYGSDSDSCDSSDTDDSWETEEEDTEDSDEGEEECKKPPTVVKKDELENLLDRATAALSKLDNLFRTMPQSMDTAQCYQEIIYIYKKCRELEKILKSSFYKDEELVSLIEEAKKRLRISRTEKYNRRIEELSKQLKEVSQNLENELTGLMKTMSTTATSQSGVTGTISEQNISQSGATGTNSEQSNSQSDATGTNSEQNTSQPVVTCTLGMPSSSQSGSICIQEQQGASKCSIVVKTDADVNSEDKTNMPTSLTNLSQTVCDKQIDENESQQTMLNIAPGSDVSMTSIGKIEGDKSVQDINESKSTVETATVSMPVQGKSESSVNNVHNAKSGIDSQTHELCLKICSMLQERMKRILEEVVPRWMAEGNILVDESMASRTSIMSISEDPSPPSNVLEEGASEISSSVQEVMSPMTPTDVPEIVDEMVACRFIQESDTPPSHKFYSSSHTPTHLKTFMSTVGKEMRLLQRCLPEGIVVRGYEDRMDLYSAMIIGPKKTPYEDAPFFFDIGLPNDYPKSPPMFHYISFCTDRLNPNLYDDGKVCVSLLGTWEGKDTETWTSNSNLLQVLVSIQGLILVDEPYYNEAGYEKHRGTQQGAENSKMYNEMAILKLVESLTNMIRNIPASFRSDCIQHLIRYGPRMIQRFIHWSTNPDPVVPRDSSSDCYRTIKLSAGACKQDCSNTTAEDVGQGSAVDQDKSVLTNQNLDNQATTNAMAENDSVLADQMFTVEFPLFPLSRGFCITMNKKLSTLKSELDEMVEANKLL